MTKIRWQTVSVSRLTGPRVPMVVLTHGAARRDLSYGTDPVMFRTKAGNLLHEMKGLCPWRPDVSVEEDPDEHLVRICVRRETSPRRMLPS